MSVPSGTDFAHTLAWPQRLAECRLSALSVSPCANYLLSILILMDQYREQLDGIFLALADPTRRAVLSRLGAGPASISELAKPFDMALPSFMKHKIGRAHV